MKWVFAQRKLGTTQSFRRVEGNRTTPYLTIAHITTTSFTIRVTP